MRTNRNNEKKPPQKRFFSSFTEIIIIEHITAIKNNDGKVDQKSFYPIFTSKHEDYESKYKKNKN